ncbi:hypothetical protein [Photobacterium damselae]|uniref:hypothetical protein n=1 Tax=Photobacterium damselae TaxID=38293 RepID=UPI004067FD95
MKGKNSVVQSNTLLIQWKEDKASYRKMIKDTSKGFDNLKKLPSQVVKEQRKIREENKQYIKQITKTAKVDKKLKAEEKARLKSVADAVKQAERQKSEALKKNQRVASDVYRSLSRHTDLATSDQLKLYSSLKRLGREFKDGSIDAKMYAAKLAIINRETSELVRNNKKLTRQNPHQQHLNQVADNSTSSLMLPVAPKVAAVGASAVGGVLLAKSAYDNVKASTAYAQDLKKQSNLSGLDVEELQAKQYAAAKAGLDPNQITDWNKDILDKLGDFQSTYKDSGGKKGVGPFEDVVTALKIDRKIIASWKTADQALSAIFDNKIFKRDKAAQRFVLESLGNDLSAASELYKNNAFKLQLYTQEFKDAALGLTEKEIENLSEVNKEFVGIDAQVSNLKNSLATGFFGDTKDDVKALQDLQFLLRDLNSLAKDLGGNLRGAIDLLTQAHKTLSNVSDTYVKPVVKVAQKHTPSVLNTLNPLNAVNTVKDLAGGFHDRDTGKPSTWVKNTPVAAPRPSDLAELSMYSNTIRDWMFNQKYLAAQNQTKQYVEVKLKPADFRVNAQVQIHATDQMFEVVDSKIEQALQDQSDQLIEPYGE